MNTFARLARSAAMAGGSRLGEWISATESPAVTSLLFHRFFDKSESRAQSIERLRRQLDWLASRYTPLSLPKFVQRLKTRTLPDRSILITTDDAIIDIAGVLDEFKAFDIPLCAFVCAGWSASASKGTGDDLLARAASAIHWYDGPDVTMRLRCGLDFHLSTRNAAENIDLLLTRPADLMPDLEEICSRTEGPGSYEDRVCSWDELRTLTQSGLSIGAHSVTHTRMSLTSDLRRGFEINESKRLCDSKLGQCEAFAYPFGMPETHNAATRSELQLAGFDAAFLTHSDFITAGSETLTLPRISMPDAPMPLPEFKARVLGAGVAVRRIKAIIRPKRVVASSV